MNQNDTCLTNDIDIVSVRNEADLIEITDGILFDAHATLSKENVHGMPIAELATLGAGVSSLIPSLRMVTQSTTVNWKDRPELSTLLRENTWSNNTHIISKI